MCDQVWVKIESVPAYYRDDNPLTDVSDYHAFINLAMEHLHADAVRCYRKHGRGVIVLGRPRGVFVEGWYGLPRTDHPSELARNCLRDLMQYDPAHELLVGTGNGRDCPALVWRFNAEQPAPDPIWHGFDPTVSGQRRRR